MARLQILELPEGSNDDRPPFVLVIDQYTPRRYITGLDQPEPVSEFDGIAEKIGARAVLVFEEAVDIPANDASSYLRETEAVWTPVDEMRANLIDTLNEKPAPQQTTKSASQEQP